MRQVITAHLRSKCHRTRSEERQFACSTLRAQFAVVRMPSLQFTTQILNIAVTIHHGGLLGVSAAQTKDTFCCVSEGTWRSSTDIPRHTPGLHNVSGIAVSEILLLNCAKHLHCAAMTAWVSLSMPSIRSINTRPSVFVTADGKIHKIMQQHG